MSLSRLFEGKEFKVRTDIFGANPDGSINTGVKFFSSEKSYKALAVTHEPKPNCVLTVNDFGDYDFLEIYNILPLAEHKLEDLYGTK